MAAEMIQVESSNIEAVGYDPERHVLTVQFRNGSTYEYEEVPSSKHQDLMAADSKGGFLNKEIKGSHSYRKIG